MFDAEYVKGAELFAKMFEIDKKMIGKDLIITGEGRLDNYLLEKLPITVTKIAHKSNVPVVFVCGQIDENININELKKIGIIDVLCCSKYYRDNKINIDDITSEKKHLIFKEKTPMILEKEFTRIGLL